MDAARVYLQKVAARYEFSSTQVNLPADLATKVRSMAGEIKTEDLVRKEFVPHITLLYGLHTTDPQPIRTLLADEPPIQVRFGKTEVFSSDSDVAHGRANDEDVVYVKVFSPDLRRLNRKIRGRLPHTMTYPKYEPHVCVAYVKKGKGHKYTGRSDLEGQVWTFDGVKFSRPSGKKTTIELKKSAQLQQPNYLNSAPVWLAAGGLGGAGLGRYFAAPVLARLLNLDPDKTRRMMTLLGMGAGMAPGLLTGLVRQKTRGSFFAPAGPPRNADEYMRHVSWALGKPKPSVGGIGEPRKPFVTRTDASPFYTTPPTMQDFMSLNKQSADDPGVWSEELWNPTYPVATAMDDVTRNPFIPLTQKVKMRQLIAQAGNEQGVGMTGAASPGALMAALPKVVRYAVPTVGGAWLASKALGAPRRVKNTAMGAALVYSAMRGFMSKDSSVKSAVGIRMMTERTDPKRPFTTKPLVESFNKRPDAPSQDGQSGSDWYRRAIMAALNRPLGDVSMTVPMQDHQWTAEQRKQIQSLE